MRLSLAPAVLAVAGLFAAGSALAASAYGIAYLGLRGSYNFTDDGSTTSTGTYDFDESYDDGYSAAIYMGWVLDDNFRLEFEGGYGTADLDQVQITRAGAAPYAVGDTFDVGGRAQMGSVMANLYYDLHFFDGPVLPWVGAGLGGAFVDYNISDAPTNELSGKDQRWVFAYQFMAGVTFPVSEGVSMSLAYRYFRTADFDYINAIPDTLTTNITQQSVDVGLQFHF